MPLTAEQRDTLVRTVLGEAANQGERGMQAVAWVIRNRAESGEFGSTDPASIATQPMQFSAWNSASNGGNNVGRNADPNSASYQRALDAIDAVFGGTVADPTGGPTYYHTPAVNPTWDNHMTQTATIGGHVFYAPPGHPVPPADIPSSPTASGPGQRSLGGYQRNQFAAAGGAMPAPSPGFRNNYFASLPSPNPLRAPTLSTGTPANTNSAKFNGTDGSPVLGTRTTLPVLGGTTYSGRLPDAAMNGVDRLRADGQPTPVPPASDFVTKLPTVSAKFNDRDGMALGSPANSNTLGWQRAVTPGVAQAGSVQMPHNVTPSVVTSLYDAMGTQPVNSTGAKANDTDGSAAVRSVGAGLLSAPTLSPDYVAWEKQYGNAAKPSVTTGSVLGGLRVGGGLVPQTPTPPAPPRYEASSVRQLQSALSSAGFKTATDGIYGPQTDASVRAFQAANGLTVDGIVGPKTTAALNSVRTGSSSVATPAAAPVRSGNGSSGSTSGSSSSSSSSNTIRGSSTGNSYSVGKTYQTADGSQFRANSDGSFTRL